ncbi:MAG: ABC transporter permease subunit [Cloacibacterium normanense]
MIAILKKELWSYFGNWSAWIIFGAFSLISALFLFFFENDFNILEIGTASLQSFFTLSPWLFLFIIPALAMKSFAEEQQNGTLQWLFSQPLSISEIVSGKFFAVFLVGILCLLPSLPLLCLCFRRSTGNLDLGATLEAISGFSSHCCIFCCWDFGKFTFHESNYGLFIGRFPEFHFILWDRTIRISNCWEAQIICFKILVFIIILSPFTRGLIDTQDVFYFLLVIGVSIFG